MTKADSSMSQGDCAPSAPQGSRSGVGGSGMRALADGEFDGLAAVGGWRGLAESVLPGLVFVTVFILTGEVSAAVIASVGVAVLATLVRLLQRTPITQAVGGLLGIGIGAVWAWRSGEAENFYVWGLLTNALFCVVIVVSIVLRWPAVGVVVSTLFGRGYGWRADHAQLRRYRLASWLWAGAFAARLVVQVPLYLNAEVGWLGTARLVMGVPLWALVLWLTWILVNPRAMPATIPAPQDPPMRK